MHRLIALVLVLGFAAGARGATPGVVVIQGEPRIVRRTYDARNPPAEMLKKLVLPEAGLCQSDFGCKILAGTDRSPFGLQPGGGTVTSIRLITDLTITIWTVIESTPKLLAHEEGHREICEDYYRRAREVALTLATRALGTPLTPAEYSGGFSPDIREAFQRRLVAEFLRETAERCIVAQDLYDAITAHGGNGIKPAAAVAQALAAERARPKFGDDKTSAGRPGPH